MDGHSLFYHAIENVLSNWAALKLAVQHSMGGIQSEAKAKWLAGAVEQYFTENDGLEQDEIQDYLVDFLNDEFDTIADDGSVSEVAKKFCTFYRLFRDDSQELSIMLDSLPKLTKHEEEQRVTKENAAAIITVSPHQSTSNDSERISHSEDMDVDMQEEEGWQTINRNRRKTAK